MYGWLPSTIHAGMRDHLVALVPLVMCKPRLCVRRQQMSLRFYRDRSGSSLIEYSLLIALVLAVSVVGIRVIGNWVSEALSVFVSP